MQLLTCKSCDLIFEDRSNRIYCSQSCKSATNNTRVAERDKTARYVERQVKANRRVLMMLYNLYGDCPLPAFMIEKTSINKNWNNGVSPDGKQVLFLDYILKELPNNYFQIIKRN